MLLGTLGTSLAGKGINRAGYGNKGQDNKNEMDF